MRAPIFRGKVLNDVIVLDNKETFRAYRKSFEGKQIDLILRERTAAASPQARGYYKKVVCHMMADKAGYEDKEMHKVILKELGIETTSGMNSKEYRDFIDGAIRIAAKWYGLPIPEPDKVDY